MPYNEEFSRQIAITKNTSKIRANNKKKNQNLIEVQYWFKVNLQEDSFALKLQVQIQEFRNSPRIVIP